MKQEPTTIVLAADGPFIRKTIKAQLGASGYRTLEADSAEALLAAADRQPALILLDADLPRMDAVGICRQLTANERTGHIPVLCLCSQQDPGVRARVLEAGAADIVDKPVERQQMTRRVALHLTVRSQQQRLVACEKQLAQAVGENKRLLIEADRLATLIRYSRTIAHEINNPVTYIMGNVELIKYTWNAARPIVENHWDEDDSGHLPKAVPRLEKKLALILEGAERVSALVREFRGYAKQAEDRARHSRLIDIINDASNLLLHRFKRGYRMDVDVPEDVRVPGDRRQLAQVFVNLFKNAMDAMDDPKGAIRVAAERRNGGVNIRVADQGPGLTAEAAAEVFASHVTPRLKQGHAGQGLHIARSILEAHGGDIRLGEAKGPGARFDITIPVADN